MTRIIVCGCLGRLGSAVCRLAEINPDVEIIAGVDVMPPSGGLKYPTYTDIDLCQTAADALLCILPPSATADIEAMLEYCVIRQIPMVLCTTGLPANIIAKVQQAADKVAVFQSANMSLGVNLLANMVNKAAKLLYDVGFDIEIIEKHHNQKLDAPSGTAYILADAANQALEGKMEYTHDRSQASAKRKRNEIGIHAIRGGTIVGEHSVIFAGQDEVIEFKHSAGSRDVFAVGAIKAAQYIKGKPAGLYGMQDLIDSIP
ncbi:MAG: 4-hydroxy-tetrahydrodipicolinate reductase [Defluviitaleaceae bacterium]|nr:4-hydroxy-tetrahydrodipicolinate reductase [Defluviitaleaceae bacterium]